MNILEALLDQAALVLGRVVAALDLIAVRIAVTVGVVGVGVGAELDLLERRSARRGRRRTRRRRPRSVGSVPSAASSPSVRPSPSVSALLGSSSPPWAASLAVPGARRRRCRRPVGSVTSRRSSPSERPSPSVSVARARVAARAPLVRVGDAVAVDVGSGVRARGALLSLFFFLAAALIACDLADEPGSTCRAMASSPPSSSGDRSGDHHRDHGAGCRDTPPPLCPRWQRLIDQTPSFVDQPAATDLPQRGAGDARADRVRRVGAAAAQRADDAPGNAAPRAKPSGGTPPTALAVERCRLRHAPTPASRARSSD